MNKIVLASASPRRVELLSKYNIKPIIVRPVIDEKTSQGETAEQIAMALAFEKANQVAKGFSDGEIIIGADTIVVCQGKILGKPEDDEEAKNMLNLLSGKEHQVITGIAIIKSNSCLKIIDFEKSIVRFRNLTERMIQSYIETGEHEGKAGGYAIQGIGGVLIEYIKGCYSNIVGLPLYKLDSLLEKYFETNLL